MMLPPCSCGHIKSRHAAGTSFCKESTCNCSAYSTEPLAPVKTEEAIPMVRTVHPMDALPQEPDVPVVAEREEVAEAPKGFKMIKDDLLKDKKVEDIEEMAAAYNPKSSSRKRKKSKTKKTPWYMDKENS